MTAIDSSLLPKRKNGDKSETIPTFWSTLNNPDLATPDIYDIKQSGTINSITKFANTFSTDLNNIISGGLTALNKVREGLVFYNNVKNTINKGTGLEKLNNINTMLKSKITGLSDGVSRDIFNEIESTNDLLIKAGETVSKITKTDWNNINSVTSLLSELSGNSKLFDLSDLNTQGKILSSLANQLTTAGVGNSMRAIMDIIDNTVKDKENEPSPIENVSMAEYVKQNLTEIVIKGSIDNSIKNNDYANIKTMADTIGDSFLRTIREDIVSELSTNYKNERSMDETSSKTSSIFNDYNLFVTTADAVDKKWFKSKYDENVIDLSQINNGSRHFIEMISTGALTDEVKDRNYLTWVKEFKKTTVKETLMKDFPLTVWMENNIDLNNF
jgi:hypothetical protein